MKCPSCFSLLVAATPQCPHCKLTLRRLDIKFGIVPRHSVWLTDRTRRLPKREIRQLRRLLRLFHGKFPQSIFSAFLTKRLPGSIAEYTFWVVNRARVGRVHSVAGNNFDLILGIDVDACSAALMIGYGLEHYLTEHDLERVLAGASGAFYDRDFSRGIRICIEMLTERMKEVVKALEDSAQSVKKS
jgi:uncharacterized membrane protein YgcG